MKIAATVRLLDESEKTEAMFQKILRVTNLSFSGVQRPTEDLLRGKIKTGDVYVSTFRMPTSDADIFLGYAIVIRRDYPYICGIAVDPNYRGMSVGGQILEAIRQTESRRRSEFIALTVQPTNPAQKLYFNAGYRVQSVAKKFYGEEGDGLVMRREL